MDSFYFGPTAGSPTSIDINGNGRYVRVQLAGTNPLSLAEVQVFGTAGSTNGGDVQNIAPLGTASQSSTSYNGSASRAIDGNTDGTYQNASVTHTLAQSRPSWRVDWSDSYEIDEIKIFNRTDCCTFRLSNFTVSVINSSGNTVFSRVISGEAPPSMTIDTGGVTGDQVRVQLNGTNPLSLAEVQVFGRR